MNNFLKLQEEEMQVFSAEKREEIADKVYGRLRTYQLFGDMAELFLPKLADTVSVMLGGDVSDPDSEYLTIEEGGWAGDVLPSGPEDRDDFIR